MKLKLKLSHLKSAPFQVVFQMIANKQNRDRLGQSKLTAVGGGAAWGGEIEQKRKKPHRHRKQCGDCQGRGVRAGGGGIEGINGDGWRLDFGW